jgi:glycine oxidase
MCYPCQMFPPPHVLIIGQGLAGTAVAWRLWQRGVPFLIVDAHEATNSSQVAAGLVTPITGLRLNVSWRVAELLPAALQFYREIEAILGATYYHELPIVRLFREAKEVNFWAKRQQESAIRPYTDTNAPSPLLDASAIKDELGGFQMKRSGWLDTASYLEASRLFFEKNDCWQQGCVSDEHLLAQERQIVWQDQAYDLAILCRGWEQSGSRTFPWLNFDSARGVIVDLESALPETRILNKGCWMLPRGAGQWRAGSTYDFDFQKPLAESTEEIRIRLEGLLHMPFSITGVQSGIRPIYKKQSLVLGRHPVRPSFCVFNGLGSKGVLRAPYFSEMLISHLLDGSPLDEEVDVRANV